MLLTSAAELQILSSAAISHLSGVEDAKQISKSLLLSPLGAFQKDLNRVTLYYITCLVVFELLQNLHLEILELVQECPTGYLSSDG